jgi:hypothetical protein
VIQEEIILAIHFIQEDSLKHHYRESHKKEREIPCSIAEELRVIVAAAWIEPANKGL